MSIKAMKQALEALEYVYEGANNQGPHTGISWRCVSNKTEPVITSLRQAIAETQQQDPVGWIDDKGNMICVKTNEFCKPLYTHPQPKREWVGLTDREKSNLWIESRAAIPRFHTYATLIEAKLKEKNA